MRNETRLKFNLFTQTIRDLNNIPDETKKFTVSPEVEQTLETRVQESSAFLTMINVVGVPEQEGEKLGLGINTTVAGTTDTTQHDRQAVDPTDLTGNRYRCEQTNFDTALRYAKIDAWAKFKDFQTRIRDAILQRQALDRIMIGFNGLTRAATSNRITNPLLQDVNKGWLQKIREDKPENVLDEVKADSGIIKVGNGVTLEDGYNNLDALVMDLTELLGPTYRDNTELVAIVGRKLLHDKYFPMVNKDQVPSEKMAADVIISQKRMGGLPAVRVPSFPDNAILVTRLDNLSIYWQEGTRRRTILDNAKRDQIENYESVNEAYVVEDYEGAALAEHIELVEPAPAV
ncbi:phage major capsid protein, P2 family [Aeromonas molluscorum]|uniref:p2 family phage major capsid protein n=1 Tax=Aeromonas molluscorum 848 TaxID=1268236 RepID=R1H0N5_9GAMM|nr:phage major capsid protein, P2 family [Aeromonas molluscorum]EOD54206.1 P2 family phage major capsid protein [Aeromonas molluscorum 848]